MKESLRGKMIHGGIWVELKSPHSPQRLELNYCPTNNKYYEKFKSGSELDHLAFWVKNVERTHERLIKRGARKAVPPFSQGKYSFAFIKDPDDLWIELIGRSNKSR
jgi:catechol 2,3-dioxygenase-like lactoylglutathione lyase family enzyme